MKNFFKVSKAIKLISAIILLFSIFLPFSSCTRYHDETYFKNIPEKDRPPKVTMPISADHDINKEPPKEYYVVTTTTYILRDFDVYDIEDWLIVLSFIWPLILFGVSKKIKNNKFKIVNWSIELILSVSAGCLIISASLFGPEIGAYISFLSNLTILILWIVEGSLMIYLKKKYKNLTNACTQTGVTLPLHTGW
ncbi:MAG: hypothetical protein GY795_32760 [Desulfobacterales bacterium]|nr:hypothetical protein [Desulfobacterales bacterium]